MNNFLKANAPVITTVLACFGVLGTSIFVGKATKKALPVIEDTDDTKEIVRRTWRYYIPPTLIGLGTVGLIVSSHRIHVAREAAISLGSMATAAAFKKYRSAVVSELGPESEAKVNDKIAADRIKEVPFREDIVYPGNGRTLCMESINGRYFYSDVETIRSHFNDVSRELVQDTFISINEAFYGLGGLTDCESGEESGWHIDDGTIKPVFSSQLTNQDIPCLVVGFETQPRYGYRGYYNM